MHIFYNVTLLITHYNRSSSLNRLLKAFEDQLCIFNQIVVSDDASESSHLGVVHSLQKRFSFELITNSSNKGLANNLNKGQDAVNSQYTLYVQEDFIPTDKFANNFSIALHYMDEDQTLDLVCFYAYYEYPYLKNYGQNFLLKYYHPWSMNYKKIYAYSDHPHLKRSSFPNRFGRYTESIKSDKAEYRMCVSFIQHKGKALFYKDYKELFVQENSEAEPSTVKREKWSSSSNLIVSILRDIYRQVKYNYDIYFR